MRTAIVFALALAGVVALANCATSRSSQADKQALTDEVAALRKEIDALSRRLDGLRRESDGRVQSLAPQGTALGFPGGDAAALRVEWSSLHVGNRLKGTLSPRGGGEQVAGEINVKKERP
ncbi:MAG: hypothetical protein AB2A00_08420 [Myxococcota bacterium]